jgi:hypothetical protein
MTEFLIGIVYHEPEAFAQWNSGLIEDYESSTGIFIESDTSENAIAWAEQIGQALLDHVNDNHLDWKEMYSCWLIESIQNSHWAHCLHFFQHVKVGEMPNLNKMTTASYTQWMQNKSNCD